MDSESINERPVPVGLRYIAYDQWLLTHIQPSWKISQIKLFVLSKCLRTNYAVPSRRQPSPITFAPPNPTHGRAKTAAMPEDGYEEDDEYNPDTDDDDINKPVSYRPSSARTVTASVPSPPPAAYTLIRFSTGQILEDSFQFSSYDISPYELLELHGEHSKSMTKPVFPPRHNSLPLSQTPPPSPPPSASSPMRLIKRIVCLDRTDIQAYVAPYWEGWVKALRVVNRDDLDLAMRSHAAHHNHRHRRTGTPSTSGASTSVTDRDASNIFAGMTWGFGGVGVMGGMGAGFGVVLDDEVLKLRDEDVMVSSSGKKKSAKLASKVKLEWKERWVVVQGDTLYICKDREDVNPSQRISLSSLVNIRDKDFLLSYPTPATSPFVPTSTPPASDPDIDRTIFDSPSPGKKGKDKLNNHTKYVICARFRSNDSEDHYHRGRASARADESGSTKLKSKKKDKERHGRDKSQQKKQKTKSQGSSYGDLSYYSPVAIAAATGIVLPLPSSATSYSRSPERKITTKREQEGQEKQRGEDDHDHDNDHNTPTATTITRPGTAVSRSGETEDIYTSPIPTGDDTQDDEETLFHQQQFQPLSGITRTTTITGLSSTMPLSQSDSMPSPLFAHSSESEWETDIFGKKERKKQPFYHDGYQPAYRWKESSEYDRARDVWEEGPVHNVGEADAVEGKKGKGKEKEKEREKDPHGRSSHHQHEWIILDLGGSSAFNSMLRVLHRGAPSALSKFKTNCLAKTENDPSELVVGSSPTRRGRPSTMSFPSLSSAAAAGADDVDEYEDSSIRRHGFDYHDQEDALRNDRSLDHEDRHRPQSPPLLTPSCNLTEWNERLGVMPYPEWRIKITKRAQRAALGNISNAMLFYLFRSLEFADLSSPSTATARLDGSHNVKKPTTTVERPKPQKSQRSQRSQRLRTASTASTATATSTSAQQQARDSSPKSSLPSDDIPSSHVKLDIGSSSDESSEMEWHGWMLDISRQYQVQQQHHHHQRHESGALGGGGSKVAGEETPTPQGSPRLVRLELDDSYRYEAMRRKALEPSGTVSTTTTTTIVSTKDIKRPAGSHHIEQRRPTTKAPRSPVDDPDRDWDGGGGQSLLPNSISPSRSVGSPPFSSPEPPISSSPPPSLAAARKRLTSMKSNNIFRSSDPPSHLISRRRPSMPQLSFEHPSTTSDLGESASYNRHTTTVEHGGRRIKGSSPPDASFSPPSSAGAGSSMDGGGSSRNTSQFIRRRASAAGFIPSNLAGSFGRSANFLIGGLWKKEKDGKEKDKDKETPRESGGAAQGSLDEREYNNNKKGKGKGKGTNNILPRPESSSREGGMARSLSPSAVGNVVISASRLETAASGSSMAATSPEDDDEPSGPSPMVGTKGERWKLKKGRLVYEMEKIARGFDGD